MLTTTTDRSLFESPFPAMHDSRPGDRTPVHYTMKTHSHSHSHSNSHTRSISQSSRSGRSNKSTTPASSPRAPYSVGQNHPPTLSPSRPDVRAPSPNYFGLVVDSPHDPRDSSAYARHNWSPASSSVKSFGAILPKHVTLDSNPEFEAFKRQADLNRGKSFALSTSHYAQPTSNPAPVRPQAPRWHTFTSDTGSEASFARAVNVARDQPNSRMDVDQGSLHDSAYVSSESKRNSESSLFPLHIPNLPRFESPQPLDPSPQRTGLTRSEDRDPRLSVMEHRPEPPSPRLSNITRSATLPSKLDNGEPAMITASDLKDLLETQPQDSIMLLDIRSAQNFGLSRIRGALNLCIPTTLLKRPKFNIEKLKETFHGGSESSKFSTWKEMAWIIVYDAHSSDKRDAVTAQNMIKKFTNEGYDGNTGILRGGFNSFQVTFPDLIDSAAAFAKCDKGSTPSLNTAGLAPVIGGVMMPTTANTFNPFFSNIRQNMDLADGVGQMDIAWPSGLEESSVPQWLREAADEPDHGKKVSDRFLAIEKAEKARMENAYASFNQGQPCADGRIQLCGVEKGGKNRYKDILPFEHARVRLQNKPKGSCDYINASHLSASRSNKRYIASQGPLPDTFEDFWSVVWEQDVRVIVMLTAELEGGQLKCHTYWTDREFGSLQLKQTSEMKVSLDIDKSKFSAASELSRRRAHTTTTAEAPATNHTSSAQGQNDTPYAIVRKFALSHAAFPFAPMREITHLHFPSWPDFGTPAQPSHLLALVELANAMQRAALPVETSSFVNHGRANRDGFTPSWYDEPEKDQASRPMLVHCSAGCGRTGTFCTVDSVVDMLKRQRLDKSALGHQPLSGVEEDTFMVDSDEPVSPLTERTMNFQRKPERQASTLKDTETSIDLSWLQEEDVDLIQKTVEDFREQRLSTVQSLRQYVLCYETVLEWVLRANDRGTTVPGGRRRSGSLQQT